MKKSLKKLGLILTITAGLALTTGCGDKKSDKVDVAAMTEKYAGYCTLGEYKGIEYQSTNTVVTEDDVQRYVDSLISTHSTSTLVTTGTANDGDTVNIDFVGTIDGVEFEGGSTGGAGYELTLGSHTMIDGFEEQIVGHNVGETFDIYVTFPEDYTAELAGLDAVFSITINSKYEIESPEYNDAFVAANTDYDTVEAYEEYLMTTLTEAAATSDEDQNNIAIVTNLINISTVNEYPQKEMQDKIDSTIQEVKDNAEASGYTLETYVTAVFGMTSVADLEAYVGDLVKSYMTEKIVLCSVAHAEGITVNEEEIKAYKEEMKEVTGITDDETFDATYTAEDVAYYTLAEKVVDYLIENGTPVEATTETVE